LDNKSTKYIVKLLDIQNAIYFIGLDAALLLSISYEMAFHWVPSILSDLGALTEENVELHAETKQLSLQNDELLRQNMMLAQHLKNQ
jgi:hypothetical protein